MRPDTAIHKLDTNLNTFIEKHRDESGTVGVLPESFCYLYGPYLINCKRFSDIVTQASKRNPILRFMNIAFTINIAVLIPEIHKREIVKSITLTIGGSFDPSNSKEVDYVSALSKIQSKIAESPNIARESMIAAMAPCVPYGEEVSMNSTFIENVFSGALDGSNKVTDRLHNMLCEHVLSILTTDPIWVGIQEGNNNTIRKEMDDLLASASVGFDTKKYYLLAMINHFKYTEDSLRNYKTFLDVMTGANATIPAAAAVESLYSPGLESYTDLPEDEVEAILYNQSSYRPVNPDKSRSFDFTVLDNYVHLHRFMDFNENSNAVFTLNIPEDSEIVNINNRGGQCNYYETITSVSDEANSKHLVVCPYTDLRDHAIRITILNGDSGEVEGPFASLQAYIG